MPADYYQIVKCCKCGAGERWLGTVTEIFRQTGKSAGRCIHCGMIHSGPIVEVEVSIGKTLMPRTFLSKLPPVSDEETEREKELEIK